MKKLDTSSFLNVQNNMTYGLTLDNSWELMSEEEMYDVNGGRSLRWYEKTAIIAAIGISAAALVVALTYGQLLLAAKIMGLTIKGFVATCGASVVATFIATSIGVSTSVVAAAFYFFTQF